MTAGDSEGRDTPKSEKGREEDGEMFWEGDLPVHRKDALVLRDLEFQPLHFRGGLLPIE